MQVTSVTYVGDTTNQWTFDTPLTAAGDPLTNLRIDGTAAAAFNAQVSPTSINVDYDDEHDPGVPWSITGPVPGLSFAGGAVLGTQAGTVS